MSLSRTVRCALLAGAAGVVALQHAAAQTGAAGAAQAAEAVARAAMAAMDAAKYDSVAALVDPRLLAGMRAQAVQGERARRRYEARQDSLARGLVAPRRGEYSELAPDGKPVPAEVRTYLAAERQRMRARFPNTLEFQYGVSTLEELEALTPAALFAHELATRDPAHAAANARRMNALFRASGARNSAARDSAGHDATPPDSAAAARRVREQAAADSVAAAAARVERRVLGSVVANDSTVYVTYEVRLPGLTAAASPCNDPCGRARRRSPLDSALRLIQTTALPLDRPALVIVRRTPAGWRLSGGRNDYSLFLNEGFGGMVSLGPVNADSMRASQARELRRQAVRWAGGAGRAAFVGPAARGGGRVDSTAAPDRLVLTYRGASVVVPAAAVEELSPMLMMWAWLREQEPGASQPSPAPAARGRRPAAGGTTRPSTGR